MKLKKISCIVLVAGMVFTSIPCEYVPYIGGLIETYADEQYHYVVDGDTCSITGFEGNDSEIVIPATIDGKTVTSIADGAFEYNTTLVSVEIPQGVIKIGDEAFQGCTGLVSVKIPESVTTMYDDTFFNCNENLVFYGVKGSYAETYAAENEIVFKDLNIDDKVYVTGNCTYIYSQYDTYCVITGFSGSDTEIEIPATIKDIKVTQIADEVFKGQKNLKTVTMNGNISSIGKGVFEDCTSLTNVNMNTGLITIGNYAFSGCTSLKSLIFPSSLSSISDYACNNCTSLENVTITKSLATIGNYAFAGCSNLTSVN